MSDSKPTTGAIFFFISSPLFNFETLTDKKCENHHSNNIWLSLRVFVISFKQRHKCLSPFCLLTPLPLNRSSVRFADNQKGRKAKIKLERAKNKTRKSENLKQKKTRNKIVSQTSTFHHQIRLLQSDGLQVIFVSPLQLNSIFNRRLTITDLCRIKLSLADAIVGNFNRKMAGR